MSFRMGKQKYPIGSGFSSILMIFVVLCLTTFGVLSYSSSRADYNLTQKNVEYITAYYEVDGKAQELLSEIDSILIESRKEFTQEKSYEDIVTENLKSSLIAEQLKFETIEENGIERIKLSYDVPTQQKQSLKVSLSLLPVTEEKRYEILEYCFAAEQEYGQITIEEEEEENGLWHGNE